MREAEIFNNSELGVRESATNSNKMIRTESMVGDEEETIRHYDAIKGIFDKMRNVYGVNVPDIEVSIGENQQGEKRVFMEVDKIVGGNLEDAEAIPQDAQGRFEGFYTKFLTAIFEEYKKSKPFYKDIKLGNIMYGHKSGGENEGDDFFLVDVGGGFQDGNFTEFHGQFIETDYDEAFMRSMINARDNISECEKKFGGAIALTTVRDKIAEIRKYCIENKQGNIVDFIKKDPTVAEFFEQ